MDNTLKLNIRLFGAFRKYHNGLLTLQVNQGITVCQVKELIARKIQDLSPDFKDQELIDKSALANAQKVLNPFDSLTESDNLAILPPVCGG